MRETGIWVVKCIFHFFSILSTNLSWYSTMNTPRIDLELEGFEPLISCLEFYVISFFLPLITLFGVIGNILIIAVMPGRKVSTKKEAKMFYLVMAIGDLGTLVFWHLREFLTTGLYNISSGTYFLGIIYFLSCKFIIGAYFCPLFYPFTHWLPIP